MKNSFLTWFLAFLCAASIATYTRLYPLRGHIWSSTNDQATMLVVMKLKQTFLQQILSQSPETPPAQANQMAEEKLNETLHTQGGHVLEAIEVVNDQLAQNSPTKDRIYLLESDPFYFYNLTENLLNTGKLSQTVKGSKYFNPLMGAPFGEWQPFSLHPYFGLGVYKILHTFNPTIPLMSAVAYVPLIVCVLTLVVFFWIGWQLGCSVLTTLAGSLFFTLAPVYIKRSALGWFDTDPYNLFFPLLLIGLLIWIVQSRRIVMGAIISGLMVCAFALFWQGWGFILVTLLATAATIVIYAQLIQKDSILRNQSLQYMGLLTLATIVSISIAFGPKEFFILCKEGFGELSKFTNKGINLWPNLFIGVGELKKSTVQTVFEDLGSIVFLGLSAAGFVISIKKALEKNNLGYSLSVIVLTVFLGITVFLTLGAERFSIFTLIPLSLFFTLGLNSFSHHIKPTLLGMGLVIALCAFATLQGQAQVRKVITPIFNETWEQALIKIKESTPQDSIVNTWWPPGHFIKAIANRSVPFDGASLDKGDVGYWMSNILLSTSEARAQGLLRMLNSSGNKAVDYLTSQGMKASDAALLLQLIAPQTKEEAQLTLSAFLKKDQIEKLLHLTHDGSPHSYLLIYNELVDDNLILKFTGKWDFKKIEDLNANPQLLKKIPSQNSPAYIDFLWTISGGPSKYSGALPLIDTHENQMLFKEGIIVNAVTKDVIINSDTFGKGKPLSIVYATSDQIIEHPIEGGLLNYSVLLYEEDGHPTVRLMDRDLANSLIMKLFYFNGKGLKYFHPLTSTNDPTNRTQIKVFQATWK